MTDDLRILNLFRMGKDTSEIARAMQLTEAAAYGWLHIVLEKNRLYRVEREQRASGQ